jgi:hypothetical protein
MSDDRDMLKPAERPLGLLERLRRDVDQVHTPAPTRSLQRRGENHELLATAGAKLHDERHRLVTHLRQAFDDVRRVPLEKPPLRAGDAIPRQAADGFEETRPKRVVQILRLELLRDKSEIAANISGELANLGIDGRLVVWHELVLSWSSW